MLPEVCARDLAGVVPVPSEASSKGSKSVVSPLICLDKEVSSVLLPYTRVATLSVFV